MKKIIFIALSLILIIIFAAMFTLTEKKSYIKESILHQKAIECKFKDIIDSAEAIDLGKNVEVTEIKEQSINYMGIVEKMTLEEKVGQMFIVAPETFSNYSTVTNFSQLDSEKIIKYNVGGFILFSKNIENPSQIKTFTSNISNVNENYKMFISIDEEGGQVARISNNKNFPEEKIENMNVVGANGDFSRAYEIGDTIGQYLEKYGFNLNFAPVGDVLLNEENKVVSKRSFGSEGSVVAKMSLNVMLGLRQNNILAVAKHFPGHGNTALDTHYGFATSNATVEEMNGSELTPFKEMIKKDVDMIMISHVIYPKLSTEEVPATLNYDIITKLLKNDLGYKGVVITDGMNMGAIAKNYSVEDSSVRAIKAGVDILLMPTDFYKAYSSIIEAVKVGDISEEQINKSVEKIMKLKFNLDNEFTN